MGLEIYIIHILIIISGVADIGSAVSTVYGGMDCRGSVAVLILTFKFQVPNSNCPLECE